MLHHLDLNVSDLSQSATFYGRLLGRLGYEDGEMGDGWKAFVKEGFYLTLVQADGPHSEAGFHRKRVGVNHLAFPAPSARAVDHLLEWLEAEGVAVLYGGPLQMGSASAPNYAVFFEDPDRVKLEYVYRPARARCDEPDAEG